MNNLPKIKNFLNLTVGHQPQRFSFWNKFQNIDPENLEIDGQKLEFNFLFDMDDKELGEFYFLFAIRRFLEKNIQKYSHIKLGHHRRFLSNSIVEEAAVHDERTYVVTPAEAENLSYKLTDSLEEDFMINQPLINRDVARYFNKVHYLPDYLKVIALSIEDGLINDKDSFILLQGSLMFPVPTIGVFPINYLIETLKKLERITEIYNKNGYKKFEGYNRRMPAFILERMMSFYHIKHLDHLNDISNYLGFEIVIDNDKKYMPSNK
jgi:hypothetical protein